MVLVLRRDPGAGKPYELLPLYKRDKLEKAISIVIIIVFLMIMTSDSQANYTVISSVTVAK
jgi:hypothetical protein